MFTITIILTIVEMSYLTGKTVVDKDFGHEMFMFKSGAKLIPMTGDPNGVTCLISGYAADGHDVTDAVAELIKTIRRN